MSVKIKAYSLNGIEQPEWVERTFDQREITFADQTFHYGMNEIRNFADDGVGLGFTLTASGIVTNTVPFGDAAS